MTGGGTVEVVEQELDAGGGAGLTQILCAPQICPFLQSLSVIHPTLGGADEEAGGGGGGGGFGGAEDEAGGGAAATQMLCAPQTCPLAQSALVLQPSLGGAELEAGGGGAGATQILC